jgi:hypothetical protein
VTWVGSCRVFIFFDLAGQAIIKDLWGRRKIPLDKLETLWYYVSGGERHEKL